MRIKDNKNNPQPNTTAHKTGELLHKNSCNGIVIDSEDMVPLSYLRFVITDGVLLEPQIVIQPTKIQE
jgi:hypothetical protein